MKKTGTTSGEVKPFLKWPGGKRLLATRIIAVFPPTFTRYIEPFLGGAAVFFALAPQKALLGDINDELINAYKQVRDRTSDVIEGLEQLRISKRLFYDLRSARPSDPVDQAIRFLYLNRTAFNGIYRVNQAGEFNVPFGCKPGTVLCDRDLINSAAKRLKRARIVAGDFEDTIDAANEGDLIYADPPYTTKHDNNGFRRYNQHLFSWKDQVRLSRALLRAVERGIKVVVSNADHKGVRALYSHFTREVIERASCVSAQVASRGPVRESLLISE